MSSGALPDPPPRSEPAVRAVLLILGLLAAGFVFERLVQVLLVVLMAVIVALALSAGARLLARVGIPRPVGVPVTLLLLIAMLAGIGVLLAPPFVHELSGFGRQLPTTARRIALGIDHTLGLRPGTVGEDAAKVARRVEQHPSQLLGPLSSIGLGLATALGALVVIVVGGLYMAISPQPLIRGLLRLIGAERAEEAEEAFAEIATAWVGWMRGVLIDMVVLGGLLFAGMRLVGLPFAIGFAVFSALMTIIPNYGSVISAIPPIAFGLARSVREGVAVAIVYVVVNQIEGNLLLPLIMGRSVRQHPAVVALGVLLAGSIFGLPGLFIAVPLISLTQILVRTLWIRPQERRAAAQATGTPVHPRPGSARAIYRAIVLGAALVVLVLVARQVITLLLASMITVIISLPLGWCATQLARRGVPRVLGALLGLLGGLAAAAGVGWLLVPRFVSQADRLVDAAPGIAHQLEIKLAQITGSKPGHVATQLQSTVTSYVKQPSHLLGPLESAGLSVATVIGGIVIGIMVAFFIAVSPEDLRRGCVALFPPPRRALADATMERIGSAWRGWLRGLAISSLLVGGLLYLGLTLIVGLPYALSFSVISAIAEVVPYLGALASGIPPVAFALTISPGTAIVVLVVYVAVHQIESNVIAPLVMGRMVHLHPAVIAFGVIAVGELFGLLGLLIAVPFLSAVSILVDVMWLTPRERARAVGPGGAAGVSVGGPGADRLAHDPGPGGPAPEGGASGPWGRALARVRAMTPSR